MDAQEDENHNVTIMWAGLPYYCFNRDEHFAKNLGIALLDALGVAQRDIQRLFKVGRNTITRVASLYRQKGANGLIGYKQGPEALPQEIQDFVVARYRQLEGIRGYQNTILEEVGEKYQKGEFARTMSRQTLHAIVKEYRQQREGLRRENEQKEQEKEEQAREVERRKREEEQRARQQPELPPDGNSRVVDCGGSVVTAVFVNEFKTMESIPEGFVGDEGEERFTNREMAFAYLGLNAAKVVTVEQSFKTLPSYLMGGMLGREKLPSLSLYRSRIPKIVQHMDMPEVIRQTARGMREVLPFSRVLYVDGHFLPYYGETAILGNYSTQKRLVIPGREYFWVHDENGMPVYATISDGYRKMRFYLERVHRDLRWIYEARRQELLLIFDRGGYSKGFCVGISDEVRFICWRTDARTIPKGVSWKRVEVLREGNEWAEPRGERFQAWEKKVEFSEGNKRRVFREVWIRKGRKVSPAVTNDAQMPLGEVVRKLLRRWGAQENGFKKLKAHGVDKIHSYLKEPYSEEYLYQSGLEQREEGIRREVDNPLLRQLDKKIKVVKRKIERQRDVSERAQRAGNEAALTKSKGKLLYLNRRIRQLKETKGKLPAKVLLHQIIQQKGIERIKSEKKLFFDWLKMAAMWSRKRILDIVKPYYGDLRDVEKFVDSILQSRTYVRITDGVMHVEFPNQHSQRKQEALQRLCEKLNECERINIGLSIQKLVFSVR
jgi:hypothetical protein